MEWRLETLHRRTEEGVRELGERILEMYHRGEVDPSVVREYAAKVEELERGAAELEEAMRGDTGSLPDPPREARPTQETSEGPGRPLRPAPLLRPVLGAEDSPPAEQATDAPPEPVSNGESD